METVAGDLHQCTYRWTSKECPHCSEPNDIAARYCLSCKGEIVDPNEKLRIDFKALKRDPTQRQTDEVLQWKKLPQVSRSGKAMDRVDVVTPYRSFSFWVMKHPEWAKARAERTMLDALGNAPPMTITYQKDGQSGFYRVLNYNKAVDEAPT
jgi:DNA repair protein RadD